MTLEHPQTITVEGYFQLEERDPKYIDGHVYPMAGGTANHDTVKSNLQSLLWSLLRGNPCSVYSSDMEVFVSETRYVHPDVMVSCDPGDRGRIQAIRFPRLVIEVLSPGTELSDRTWKLKQYHTPPTIAEYILADSRSPEVEVYWKKNGLWIYDACEDGERIALHSLGLGLSLADIYTDVEFEDNTKKF